jgi:predicted dehydrogenase
MEQRLAPIRTAIVGLGVMGGFHYRVISALEEFEIVALCDPQPRGSYPQPLFGSVEQLLATVALDAVIIAAPTGQHAAIAQACIARGCAVFVEKPAASTATEALMMRDALQRAGALGVVGHIERFNPVVQALRGELAGKPILSIAFTRVGHNPPRIRDVGVLVDLAVHDIDLLRFITGAAVCRSTVYATNAVREHHEDNAHLSFELEGGILGSISTNWLTPFKRRRIEVTTADAYYEADLITQQLTEFSAYRDDNAYLTRHCFVPKLEPLVGQMKAFARLLQRGEWGALATFDDSIFTLQILEQGTR